MTPLADAQIKNIIDSRSFFRPPQVNLVVVAVECRYNPSAITLASKLKLWKIRLVFLTFLVAK